MAELTQRFSGRSLEEAIGNATDALGSGAEVLEAKRVRRGGILGVMKHDSSEVSARAPAQQGRGQQQREQQPRRQQPAPSFDHQLASMIDEVDLREERQVFSPAAAPPQEQSLRVRSGAAGRARVASRFTDDDLMPLPAEPARAVAPRTTTAPRRTTPARPAAAPARAATAPAPAMAGARSAAPRRESATERQLSHALASSSMGGRSPGGSPGDALPPPPGRRPSGEGGRASTIDLREEPGTGPVWSTERLRELGVAEVVLELMPTASLDSDVAWTVALEAAIRARLPLTPTVPLAVHGYGDNAAVKMLESTLNGYAMGDLHLIDRVVPATSFELTLAIRACLSR